jgi:uncharacterized protein with gpF-like domain
MAQLLGNKDRQRERALFEALMIRISARTEKAMAQEISRAMKAAAVAYEKEGDFGLLGVHHDHIGQVRRILTACWKTAVDTFGQRIVDQAKGYYPRHIKSQGVVRPEMYERILAEYVGLYGGDEIELVSNTTKQQIRQVINNVRGDGGSVPEIAKELRSVAPGFGRVRALCISRTETHSAAGYSQDEMMNATGMAYKQEWVACLDGREREEHAAANGQVVGKNDAFIVGGETLQFPGDPAGSAGNIINCRCCAVYEVV